MLKVRRVIFLVPAVAYLAACAPIVSLLGMGSPAIQFASQLDQVSLVAGGVVFVGSGKTISDHVLSNVTGDNCKMINVVTGSPICVTEGEEHARALAALNDTTGPGLSY